MVGADGVIGKTFSDTVNVLSLLLSQSHTYTGRQQRRVGTTRSVQAALHV